MKFSKIFFLNKKHKCLIKQMRFDVSLFAKWFFLFYIAETRQCQLFLEEEDP